MKKSGTIILFFLLFSLCLKASHLMGGDITWACLGNGQYKFTMRIYRDCNGIPLQFPISIRVWNHPTVKFIPMTLANQNDISPQCNGSGPTINCGMGNTINPVPGAVEEFVLESAAVNLPGIPPPQGWAFTYDICCRNQNILNLVSPNTSGITLRAIMYNYSGRAANPCFDSSPVFTEKPVIIICGGTPYNYNHNAYDPDLDSLHYSWANPLNGIDTSANAGFNPLINQPPALAFAPNFSITQPLPGQGNLPGQNPNNVPITLNPNTGQASFTSYNFGGFVITIRVQAYKCGQLVAEIFREINIVILNCGANFPPNVTAPFTDPITSLPSFDTIVTAGDLVNFTLSGTDLEYLPIGAAQSVSLSASGGQYGNGFVSANAGCSFPPCATLNPAPPFTGPPGQGVQTTFNWQTTCNHIAQYGECYAPSNLYTFVFRVKDDYCPAPGQAIITVGITVLAQPTEPSPELRCLYVLPNGDVQLSWQPIPNTVNTFGSYKIFSSSSLAGPYTLIDSVLNINTATYTHIGAGANTQSKYYFIRTGSGCDGLILSPAIDTLQSIYLNVTNPNNGANAQLNWNTLHMPGLPTTSPWYRIYKEYPSGTWVLIDSTQIQSYSDPLSVCSDTINYRVEVNDAFGCISSSNVNGRLFQNGTPPSPGVIDTVSVNANGKAVIGWQPGPSPDAVGYIIYQSINGGWAPIDTVLGYNNTNYTNPNSNAGAAKEIYAIAAFDSCGGYGTWGELHNTVYLQATVDPCTGATQLLWNPYLNMLGGVANYIIYQSQNNGAYTVVATVQSNGYTVQGVLPGSNYCYYVQAVNANGSLTASSSIACVSPSTLAGPQFQYLNRATVLPYGEAYVSCLVDTNASSIVNYKLYRTDTVGGAFAYLKLLERIPGERFVTYVDLSAETYEKSYLYKMSTIDKCGNESKISNVGSTILLKGTANDDLTNTLTWNRYQQWDANVERYDLYRKADIESSYNIVANFPPSSTYLYDDNIRAYTNSNGLFCYYIEAIENNGNIYGLKDTSRSNILCLQQTETVYIPNAFTPDGLNPIFMPVGTFVDSVRYSFLIYNRWGELMYESYKPGEGWDGTYKGKKAEEGVYAYLLRYQTTGYRDVKKLGTVLMLR